MKALSVSRRSALLGVGAGLFLAAVFVAVVAGTAGWAHLLQQVGADWWLLGPLVAGFAAQVALMIELRRRRRSAHVAAMSVGAGAGASGLGMIACCAHHVADLAPLAGSAGIATFLTGAQRPLMVAGLIVNTLGLVVAAHRLSGFVPPQPPGADGAATAQASVGVTCTG